MQLRRPVRFERFLSEGGSTKPWLMQLANESGAEEPFVVKVFKKRAVEQAFPIAKEFIANRLAIEFHLFVPEACLVDFDKTFLASCLDDTLREELTDKDNGYKFACRHHQGFFIRQPETYATVLAEHDLANIYAFDTLIQNIDRGGLRNKPNLLIDDNRHMLIDHEQCLIFTDGNPDAFHQMMAQMEAGRCPFDTRKHLLYPALHRKRRIDRQHLFDEFEECLSRLNIDPIVSLVAELSSEFDIHLGNPIAFGEYLRWLCRNHVIFRRILDASLQ